MAIFICNAITLLAVSRRVLMVLALYYKKFLLSCVWFKRLSSIEEFTGGGYS